MAICVSQGTRYDSQVAVFGKALQGQLERAKLFLVGAGALGCEFIKNFACMGVATAADGVVVLTDDDVIEKSNLSRQFLFRDWNIGRCVLNAQCMLALLLETAAFQQVLQCAASSQPSLQQRARS